ncbi:MAG: aminotransferase class V-fold PLP-dependent enzyme [Pseudomonadota bacterium]|nr:aminotransferase class V-fold PLP-dependent enzyme [Pseudomonadota bacterium]
MSGVLDVARLRAETPGTAHCIHLNNAGAALMPQPVIDAVQEHVALEAHVGGHAAAARRKAECEAVYASLARLINAQPDEIAIMDSHTRAWQMAFYGLSFGEGDRILTSRAEYGANYVAFLQMRRRSGCVIEVIPDDGEGASDPAALDRMIDGRVKLIAVTWLPTNGGLINPAAEIGRVTRRHGIPYLLDACQAVGQMPVDVAELGCDFLTGAGRKWLRGPRGTGFLYVKREMLTRVEPAMLDHTGARWTGPDSFEMQPGARRYEVFEHAPALRLGLGKAVDYALEAGIENIESAIRQFSSHLREELKKVVGVTVHDRGPELSGLVTLSHRDVPADRLKSALEGAGINASISRPDGALLDAIDRELPDMLRLSPHCYNTWEELEAALRAIREAG